LLAFQLNFSASVAISDLAFPEFSRYLLQLSITFFTKIPKIIIEFPDYYGYFRTDNRHRLQSYRLFLVELVKTCTG
jgi:hypothetical protein